MSFHFHYSTWKSEAETFFIVTSLWWQRRRDRIFCLPVHRDSHPHPKQERRKSWPLLCVWNWQVRYQQESCRMCAHHMQGLTLRNLEMLWEVWWPEINGQPDSAWKFCDWKRICALPCGLNVMKFVTWWLKEADAALRSTVLDNLTDQAKKEKWNRPFTCLSHMERELQWNWVSVRQLMCSAMKGWMEVLPCFWGSNKGELLWLA